MAKSGEDQYQRELQRLREELTELLAAKESTTKPVELDQTTVGRLSRMDAIQHQKMALANKQSYQRKLRQVEAALARIESGEYGECVECGETIKPGRLKARPETPYCITCQRNAEGV